MAARATIYVYIQEPYNTSAATVGYTNLGYYGRLYKQLKSLKFFPPLFGGGAHRPLMAILCVRIDIW